MQYMRKVGSGCPSRFAGGQRTVMPTRKKVLNATACRVQTHVRFEQHSSAARQCKQEANSFESKSAKCSFGAVLYVWSQRLQGKQHSSYSCSRLTLSMNA